jgi:hypothetical protein
VWGRAGVECRNERRIVTVCDFNGRMSRPLVKSTEVEAWRRCDGEIELRRCDGGLGLQIDRALVFDFLDRNAVVVVMMRSLVPGQMRMNRRLVMVIGLVYVRVQERGVQRPDRHGREKHPCHDPAPR